jgi:hypothetical protein
MTTETSDIVLHVRNRGNRDRRHDEPVTWGIPLPSGAYHQAERARILNDRGEDAAVQARVLERWPDGSIRWLLVDFHADSPSTYRLRFTESPADQAVQPALSSRPDFDRSIRFKRDPQRVIVETGGCAFAIEAGDCLFRVTSPGNDTPSQRVTVVATDRDGQTAQVRFDDIKEETVGPLRLELVISGVIELGLEALHVATRLHFFAVSAVVRVEVAVLNSRRAQHPGNFWELGDTGSVPFRDLSLRIDSSSAFDGGSCIIRPGEAPIRLSAPAAIYQESSGGENWQSSVHVNRDGRVPLRFRGFRLEADGVRLEGLRAAPVLIAEHANGQIGATVRHFWQNFPKALELGTSDLTIRLFPRQFPDLHELQGGEQKTHVVGLTFGTDAVGNPPLAWIIDPSVVSVEPEWYARSEAVPYLMPLRDSQQPEYESLVAAAVEGSDTFEQKRERIDEYGWRNFGDIYADHEAVGQPQDRPLVSHYNNQYDAIAGFAIQFIRSGDLRWWAAMEELAAHVSDIDIYHTTEDKAAYNGGLFWHTAHYTDAGRASHRTYPRAPGIPGGGPSNEHNYATGLMLHHLLTGCASSRQSAVQLADWVLAMDDGRRTVFRWLTRAATGLASSTASTLYHGPGRGAGNSVVTLLNAHRMTLDRRYLTKAEQLIRRCIHPADDIAARNLLDAEQRWSYTVFLQALGRYLDEKIILGEVDEQYRYARDSLLHYARWMAQHEYPYLDKPNILEFPTETWAAQDIRKSEVFAFAMRHSDSDERRQFKSRSEFFLATSLRMLGARDTRSRARPVAIMLSNGHSVPRLWEATRAPEGPTGCDFGLPATFAPQRQIAFRRAILLAVVGILTMLAALAWFVTSG